MGIKTLKAEFDLLWARVEESSLENEFLDYLRDQYDLWDFVSPEIMARVLRDTPPNEALIRGMRI